LRGLLDLNVVIALLDPDHVFHERAHDWWAADSSAGWSSCPITENGVVRIMLNPGYSPSAPFSPDGLVENLRSFQRHTNHEFWHDDVSLLDPSIFDFSRVHGPRQVTDFYLLALASARDGRLVTFDRRIPVGTVRTARKENLFVI